jgi:hypothetical protein
MLLEKVASPGAAWTKWSTCNCKSGSNLLTKCSTKCRQETKIGNFEIFELGCVQ